MPVHRFRSADEMNQPRWREPSDPELHRTIAALWSFGRYTFVRRFPPGVYKHRSIERLNEQTEKWAVANFEVFRRTRRDPATQNNQG